MNWQTACFSAKSPEDNKSAVQQKKEYFEGINLFERATLVTFSNKY